MALPPDVDVISSADVLVDLLRHLNSSLHCYFPVEVFERPMPADVAVVVGRPLHAEPLPDCRGRARDCYRRLCLDAFVQTEAIHSPAKKASSTVAPPTHNQTPRLPPTSSPHIHTQSLARFVYECFHLFYSANHSVYRYGQNLGYNLWC